MGDGEVGTRLPLGDDASADVVRVWVVGVAGSGKSTFARSLATAIDAPHVELDAVAWLPDWGRRPAQDVLDLLDEELAGPRWVVEGQHPEAVDAFAERSTCIVWLDPPVWRSWPRVVRRTFRRLRTQERFCGDNRETVASVFGVRSMIPFALRSYRGDRRRHRLLFARLDDGERIAVRVPAGETTTAAQQLATRLVRPLDGRRGRRC